MFEIRKRDYDDVSIGYSHFHIRTYCTRTHTERRAEFPFDLVTGFEFQCFCFLFFTIELRACAQRNKIRIHETNERIVS